MCIAIIRNNYLVGGRTRAEARNPGHWARHALLHMAADCAYHSATWAGRVSFSKLIRVAIIAQKFVSTIVDSIGQNSRPMRWRCDSFRAYFSSRSVQQKNSNCTSSVTASIRISQHKFYNRKYFEITRPSVQPFTNGNTSPYQVNNRAKTIEYNSCPIVRLSPDAIVWWDYRPNPNTDSPECRSSSKVKIVGQSSRTRGKNVVKVVSVTLSECLLVAWGQQGHRACKNSSHLIPTVFPEPVEEDGQGLIQVHLDTGGVCDRDWPPILTVIIAVQVARIIVVAVKWHHRKDCCGRRRHWTISGDDVIVAPSSTNHSLACAAAGSASTRSLRVYAAYTQQLVSYWCTMAVRCRHL